ncbi:unnamed protein product [Hymenolepis diminuta]|uniref:Uncharacterized protein n=1 Tax=Hymenolepis diminuta TaxID=6216 RepID=A0A564YQ69_HYMDI|nr:unnamed protein product [Hymenolepis diminuta]
MSRVLRPVFRFRSLFSLFLINEAVGEALKNIYGQHSVLRDSPLSLTVGQRVRVEFSHRGSHECEFTVSFTSEDCDFGINVCSTLSQLFDIY